MSLSSIPIADLRCMLAAEGWVDLGDGGEAKAELSQISPALQSHPKVLEIRWRIGAKAKDWNQCAELGRALAEAVPDQASGWINHAYALHELKRTQEAWDVLSPLTERFPDVSTIPYNLACYACQMGNLQLAELMLEVAMKIDGPQRIKAMALKDTDLGPLWEKIRER